MTGRHINESFWLAIGARWRKIFFFFEKADQKRYEESPGANVNRPGANLNKRRKGEIPLKGGKGRKSHIRLFDGSFTFDSHSELMIHGKTTERGRGMERERMRSEV